MKRSHLRRLALLLFAFAAALPIACNKKPSAPVASEPPPSSAAVNPPPAPAPEKTPVYTYEIVSVHHHDRGAFTQGLFFLNGVLYESTGLNGRSSLRKVDLDTGSVLQQTNVPDEFFAEGLATLNHKLYQLTWTNHTAFVYDLDTFRLEKQFSYPYEGWGLTTDGQSLILSDGSPQIRFLDPATFKVQRVIDVTYQGRRVPNLNELEYIKGEIFANIWGDNEIARIQPASGRVTGIINCVGLLPAEDRDGSTDVLNGIAYDDVNDRLFVTGKCWPKLFEVKLKPVP